MLLAQWTVVGLLVGLSALYSVWRLLGISQRLWLLERVLPVAHRAHVGWPARLKASLQLQALKGCGSCASNVDAVRTQRSGAPRH